MHPLRRYGTPEDMANLVNWLFGDEARYATWQLWILDGGNSAKCGRCASEPRPAPEYPAHDRRIASASRRRRRRAEQPSEEVRRQ